jgi:SAM-dependent methyltransferase
MNAEELDQWFDHVRLVLETAYCSHQEAWRQSGMSGPEERWTALRKPVADCIDRPGSFLDVGCANGYLLECCLKWTSERGISIDPYGLDISTPLVELARQRMPHFADHYFVGNAYFWQPVRRFDFVRTELVYVPAEYERAYVERLIRYYLEPEGKLLVANYGEDHPDPAAGLLPGCYPAKHLLERLAELGIVPLDYRDGYDPVKGRKVRVAILDQASVR